MAHDRSRRARAFDLYVRGETLDSVAAQVGAAVSTLRRWRQDGAATGTDWDKARDVYALSKGGQTNALMAILRDMVPLLGRVQKEIEAEDVPALKKAEALAKLSDSFSKVSSSVAKLTPELSRLSVASDTVGALVDYVLTHHKDAAATLLPVLEGFSPWLSAHPRFKS